MDEENKIDDVIVPSEDIDVIDCSDLEASSGSKEEVFGTALLIGAGVAATLFIEHAVIPAGKWVVNKVSSGFRSTKEKIKAAQAEKAKKVAESSEEASDEETEEK